MYWVLHDWVLADIHWSQIQEGHKSDSTILTICGEVNTTNITTKGAMRLTFVKGGNQTIGFKVYYDTTGNKNK
jgi:hypothetical protein